MYIYIFFLFSDRGVAVGSPYKTVTITWHGHKGALFFGSVHITHATGSRI